MADDYQINSAFRSLGGLYAAEHAEADDEGASQVQNLIQLLRKFKAHEQAEHARVGTMVREASYDTHDGRAVYYQAPDTLRDAVDLYTVLGENHGTGSPNVENMQARDLLGRLQRGGSLAESQIGLLRGLLTKHQASIDALRATRDRGGQDLLAVPSGGADSRIITKGA